MGRYIDLTGMPFGKLIVVRRIGTNDKGRSVWECVCECDGITVVLANHLTSGNTKSCGCLISETNKKRYEFPTFIQENWRLYKVWDSMKKRCYQANATGYKYYGERGIIICEEWKNNFSNFKEWSDKNGYDSNADYGECTIDRIDSNGNYEPLNCRWVSMKTQLQNRRKRKNKRSNIYE